MARKLSTKGINDAWSRRKLFELMKDEAQFKLSPKLLTYTIEVLAGLTLGNKFIELELLRDDRFTELYCRIHQAMLAFTQRTIRLSCRSSQCLYSTSTSTSSAPPLLLKIRDDMKTAMRAKDTNRLNALKGLLADVTNASKTSKPINTNMQVLALLRKRSNAAKDAAQGFQNASRQDLKEKEDAQAKVFDEYAGTVETVGDDEIAAVVKSVVEELKAKGERTDKGMLIKKLIGPGGAFEGKNVEKAAVAQAVQNAV